MDIRKGSPDRQKTIGALSAGDTFLHHGELHIRADEVDGDCRCVRLASGFLYGIPADTVVTPVDSVAIWTEAT